MNIINIIEKKRDNEQLNKEEIEYCVNGYVENKIPDYQISSLLMAIYFNGLNDEELVNLTLAMADSGEKVDLSTINGETVDKHSTGGVGDKTTLIVGPIAAALGCKVAKMSGRGLGFTGGTVDKLESIEGYKTEIERNQFLNQVNEIGISLIGQSGNLTPADKKIYALRDVTGTVESIPLIASSIMSKKIAAGSKSILLDVKVGSGAFMKDINKARELAQKMVSIGKLANRNVIAILTNMDVPLGKEIGNSREVIEAVQVLKGEGEKDLTEVSIYLASYMLMMCKSNLTLEKCKEKVIEVIQNGKAFEKFKDLVKAQGGNTKWIENFDLFPKAKYEVDVIANQDGYIAHMNTDEIGKVSGILGAGRSKKEDKIDYSAGISILKKTGEYINKGDIIAKLYTNKKDIIDISKEMYEKAITISQEEPKKEQLIYEVVV